jgi:hypothetical protein
MGYMDHAGFHRLNRVLVAKSEKQSADAILDTSLTSHAYVRIQDVVKSGANPSRVRVPTLASHAVEAPHAAVAHGDVRVRVAVLVDVRGQGLVVLGQRLLERARGRELVTLGGGRKRERIRRQCHCFWLRALASSLCVSCVSVWVCRSFTHRREGKQRGEGVNAPPCSAVGRRSCSSCFCFRLTTSQREQKTTTEVIFLLRERQGNHWAFSCCISGSVVVELLCTSSRRAAGGEDKSSSAGRGCGGRSVNLDFLKTTGFAIYFTASFSAKSTCHVLPVSSVTPSTQDVESSMGILPSIRSSQIF